jgi:excisionase family DNA binding protein
MSPTRENGRSPVNDILTLEEVASYLRLTPQTIYKWAQEKRIPGAKLGKEWRFRKSIIDRWLDDQILRDDSGFSHLRNR